MTDEPVILSVAEAEALARDLLVRHGLCGPQADAVAAVVAACERDECRSHGLYRLPGCVATMRAGRLRPSALPEVEAAEGAIVRVNAGFGFSPLSFETGRPLLAEKARRFGLAALAINDCFHFTALWPEVEALAQDGLVALAMTPSHAWVAPAGGRRPALGTNPIAFAWPRPGREPYVFDFATSQAARGEIELHRQRGEPIPPGWALDPEGAPTTDATAAMAGVMLPFGGHKGSALSTMIELMAGALIGDLTSLGSQRLDGGAGVAPCHGEIVLAFDPARFARPDAGGEGAAEELFAAIAGSGARLPSGRRFEARARTMREGVSVSRRQWDILQALG